jgi:hypothetical protein
MTSGILRARCFHASLGRFHISSCCHQLPIWIDGAIRKEIREQDATTTAPVFASPTRKQLWRSHTDAVLAGSLSRRTDRARAFLHADSALQIGLSLGLGLPEGMTQKREKGTLLGL